MTEVSMDQGYSLAALQQACYDEDIALMEQEDEEMSQATSSDTQCGDYELLAHVYANRLKKGLGNLINETQSAFVKGRRIHNHTRLILVILDYNSLIPHNSFILFLDFFKAYDTLEHPFLFKTLELFGFETNFCNIVRMLHTDINSSLSLNRRLSMRFPVKCGIQQGCPISPLLFILAAETMAIFLKKTYSDIQGMVNLRKEFLTSQTADDTALLLKNKNMVSKAINKISLFSKASALMLNLKKCELLDSIANIPVKNEVKYLGLMITKNKQNREDLNVTPGLNAVHKSLNHWLTRDLSIHLSTEQKDYQS